MVGKIRENVLTESNIRELVRMVDEEMDGVAKEQRQRLETIESELAEVRRRLDRLYNLVETTDLAVDDFKPRIREHRERQEKLEASAAEARSMLSERREVLDDVETITAYAQDLSVFLNESELTERRAFIESFVKEIVVMPGNAVVPYTIPISQSTPKTELLVGGRSEEFWVGNEAEASSQLVGDGAVLSLRCIASPQTYLCTSRTAGWLSPTSLQADPTLPTCVVCTPSITSLFFNRHKQLRYSWAVDLDAGR